MLCVVDNTNLLGVITKADLLPLVDSKKRIKEIMKKEIHTVSSNDRVIHARRVMINENIARIPVVDQGILVGMISDNEIAFAFANIKRSFPLGHQKHQLDELLINEVMKIPPIWADPNITAAQAATVMLKKNMEFSKTLLKALLK